MSDHHFTAHVTKEWAESLGSQRTQVSTLSGKAITVRIDDATGELLDIIVNGRLDDLSIDERELDAFLRDAGLRK